MLRVIVQPGFRGIGLTRKLLSPDLPPAIRCIMACSALGRFFPFFLGAGFERVEHTRNQRYPEHDDLAAALRHLPAQERVRLNHYAASQAYYESLPADPRARLREVSHAICLKSNVDYCLFTARCIGLDEELAVLRKTLTAFFDQVIAYVPDEQFGTLLSEALFFPVQGFLKPLNA